MTEAKALTEQTLSAVALPVGTNLCGDQFTITSRLSAGGFGITYRAKDNFLGRIIVIKECFSDDFCLRSGKHVIARNEASAVHFKSIAEMFIREARSLAKLRHPNIVGVHRAFEENGTAYMALDLIDGCDLDQVLAVNAATLPPKGVKDMLLRLLDAIETIHDQDLLHRDISPDNIVIEKDGNPVLIDFGAARGDASRRTRAVSSLLVVKDGYSPQEFYMAGSIQEPCSDLYALASTFYHVLSGEAPPNSQVRMVDVASQKPDPCVPLAGRIEGYAPAFLEAIDAAMQPLPRDRLQSASEWIDMILGSETTDVTETAPDPAVAKAADLPPKELAASLSQLIEETNEEVRKTRAILVEPAPEAAPEPRRTSAPEWVEEFNQEALEQDAPSDDDVVVDMFATDTQNVDDAAPAPAPKAQPESDWINRIREKTERSRAIQTGEIIPVPDAEQRQEAEVMQTARKSLGLTVEPAKDAPQPMSKMIGPLLAYLATGIALGLGVMMFIVL
jgi:serine/threonine protein kinase